IAVCSNKVRAEENLCYYNQTLYFDEESYTIEGKQTIGFYNYTNDILENVCLHLYPNAFRQGANASVVSLANYEKAYPNGKDYGNISIESVNAKQEYLTYSICGTDQNILEVQLGKELFPDELFEFEVGFSVKLANINHRLGYGNSTINICNYYPILCVYENGDFVKDLYNSNGDPFYSKVANYQVSITYDKQYTLASTGTQKNIIDGENKVTTIKAENVRDFAMVLSSKYQTLNQIYNDVELNYYYYDDTTPKQTLTVIKEVLDLNKKYGKYPYKTLSVAEANFVHGGMEYPNLVLISDDLADYETYINVVVHELCHQWWYGVVGNNQYTYGFLDEGLTDYNTAKFYEAYPKYGLKCSTIFNNATNGYTTFTKVYNDVKKDFSTKMIRRLDEFETENEYVYLTYVKGMLMFASLEELIGTKRMDKCITAYYNTYKFKEATPQDLVNAFSRASGKNLQSFFDSWFNGEVVLGSF
ncbi:MAG: M1 family metallopeptidase, partial [Clostridia bacterium]|nr:M1 family metallopeptidase [Clostridia bacterium]